MQHSVEVVIDHHGLNGDGAKVAQLNVSKM